MTVTKTKATSLETALKDMQSSDLDKRAKAVLTIHNLLNDSGEKAQVISNAKKVAPPLVKCLIEEKQPVGPFSNTAQALKRISSAGDEGREAVRSELVKNIRNPRAKEVLNSIAAKKDRSIDLV